MNPTRPPNASPPNDLLAALGASLDYGLRTRLAEGYGLADLRADTLAGLVVGVVALPLSMALAIASGVPPQYGCTPPSSPAWSAPCWAARAAR